MRIHHLSCGSLCPHGGRLIGGEGGPLCRAEIVCHCLLIESADGLVLVDTGFGSDDARNPAQLGPPFRPRLQPRPRLEETALAQVEALGFAAADVRHIVATHLDPDHAGGLPDFPDGRGPRAGGGAGGGPAPEPARTRPLPSAPTGPRPALGRARLRGGRRPLVRLRERPHPARPRRRGGAGAADRPLARPHRRRRQQRRRLAAALRRRLLQPRRRSRRRPSCPPGLASSRASSPPTTAPASPTRSACASWPPPTATRSPSSAPTTRTSWSGSRRRAPPPRRRERAQHPEPLWEPSAELVERSRLTEFMRWLRAERGLEFDDYDALWQWSVDDLDGFWGAIWDFFEVRADGDRATVLASREMPGARWFPDTRLNYAEHVFAGKADDGDGDPARLRAARARRARAGASCAPRSRACAAALRGLGVERGDRVVAYLPNIPEAIVAFLASASIGAVWSSCSPDFGPASVVDRFAQIEPKVLFAVDGYRYGGKDFDRRETIASPAGGDAEPGAHRRPPLPRPRPRPLRPGRRHHLGRAARRRRGRRAQLRARPLRPPALGPLLLRHDRPAEGDRPGPGRDPARAPEEAPPPRRRPPRRPPLLVHHDRLDDVELPRLRAADQGGDRPLRRQPRPPRHGRALGPGRARRGDDVRHQRLLHRRLHEGRGRARRRARPQPPRRRRLDRLAALARGLRLDLRARRRRHLAVLDQRRHRPLHRLRRRRRPAAGLPRRAAGAGAGRRGRGLGRGRATRSSTRSASWS